jgi:site-specific DNA-methyltransferase (adenine-specific)
MIWMSARNARRIYRHQWKGRMRKGSSEARMHVSEKPVALMAWMIETVRTPVDSLVCDPYMGSGITGAACIRTGRRFLGIEIDPGHYATACARIEQAWAGANGGPDRCASPGRGDGAAPTEAAEAA